MEYRRFGKTELQIPVISCGGMRYQQSWKGDDPVSEESQRNLEATIRRSLELGINHIETARGYGTSELQLGKILPELPRDELIIQTKVGPMDDLQKFTDTFEESMRLLNMDYLDLFAFHGINDPTGLENANRCLDKVLQWKKEGRIRHIGFSTHGPADIIVQAIETGAFDYVNLHWYYIFQDNWPAIEAARKLDLGVFIISPNDKGGMLYKNPARFAELTAPLHPMVFNGLFCLSRPEVHTLSCGVSCPEDFGIHIETAELSKKAGEVIEPILAKVEAGLADTVGAEYARTWHVGLPEWNETPGEINIPWILRLRNLALAYDMTDFARMRYNLLGNGGIWFPGNKADKVDEVDLSACLAKSPHRDVIPGYLRETHEMLEGEAGKRLQED